WKFRRLQCRSGFWMAGTASIRYGISAVHVYQGQSDSRDGDTVSSRPANATTSGLFIISSGLFITSSGLFITSSGLFIISTSSGLLIRRAADRLSCYALNFLSFELGLIL